MIINDEKNQKRSADKDRSVVESIKNFRMEMKYRSI